MDNLFRYKTFYKFDSLDRLTQDLDDDDIVHILDSDSGAFISCPVFFLRHDLRFLLRLEVQVYDERPKTYYL